MTDNPTIALNVAVRDAISLLRARSPDLSGVLAPVSASLDSLCATLQEAAAASPADEAHAGVLVVARDVISSALDSIGPKGRDENTRALLLALATVHNRLVAALEACTSKQDKAVSAPT